jgi:hypothetical protein
VPPLAFGFKHNKGCGHGVGPLAVLPASFKSKPKREEPKTAEKHADRFNAEVVKEIEKEEIKVEEKVENKPEKKLFGKITKKE